MISLQRVGGWGSPRRHEEGSRVPSANGPIAMSGYISAISSGLKARNCARRSDVVVACTFD